MEPSSLTANPNAALARIIAGIQERHPNITPGPVDDTPNPDEPGHPEYHRRVRAEWALDRWTAAVPPRYRHATATVPDVQAWA
ncbi:ATP-binding protein, partial [Streptomyces sp. NPDC056544]